MSDNLDSWDSYISGNFLKADSVTSEEQAFVCKNVAVIDYEGDKKLRLSLESNEEEWDFDLNKTNAQKLKELGLLKPRDVIGKILYFRKVVARNPSTNKEVDSLRIKSIKDEPGKSFNAPTEKVA